MRLFDFVYAHIYYWYYRMQMNGRKVEPQHYTTIAFVLWFAGLFLLIIRVHDLIFRPILHINGLVVALAALIAGGILREVYSRNDRYLKAFNKYTSNGQDAIKGKPIILAWLFILAPLALFAILLFVRTHPLLNYGEN